MKAKVALFVTVEDSSLAYSLHRQLNIMGDTENNRNSTVYVRRISEEEFKEACVQTTMKHRGGRIDKVADRLNREPCRSSTDV